jgi:hypothetical protein
MGGVESRLTDEQMAELLDPQTFDTISAHQYDSWKDADLYRAIDAPEYPAGHPKHEAEIAEYVQELKNRKAEAERLAARSAELREKYQI